MDNPQSWIILWDYFTLYNLNFKTAQKEYHPSPLIDHIIKELTSKKSQKRSRSEPPWHPHCIMGTAKKLQNYKHGGDRHRWDPPFKTIYNETLTEYRILLLVVTHSTNLLWSGVNVSSHLKRSRKYILPTKSRQDQLPVYGVTPRDITGKSAKTRIIWSPKHAH